MAVFFSGITPACRAMARKTPAKTAVAAAASAVSAAKAATRERRAAVWIGMVWVPGICGFSTAWAGTGASSRMEDHSGRAEGSAGWGESETRIDLKDAELRVDVRFFAQRAFGEPWTRLARGHQNAGKLDQIGGQRRGLYRLRCLKSLECKESSDPCACGSGAGRKSVEEPICVSVKCALQ